MSSPISLNKDPQASYFLMQDSDVALRYIEQELAEMRRENERFTEAFDTTTNRLAKIVEEDRKTCQELLNSIDRTLEKSAITQKNISAGIKELQESQDRRAKIEEDIIAMQEEIFANQNGLRSLFGAIGERFMIMPISQRPSITSTNTLESAPSSPPSRTLKTAFLFVAGAIVAGASSLFLSEKAR